MTPTTVDGLEAVRMSTPPPPPRALATISQDMSVEQVVAHALKVRQIISALFKREVHYGVVPGTDNRKCPKCGKYRTLVDGADAVTCDQRSDGCGTQFDVADPRVWVKKTIYQPGVDLLCLTFKLSPQYRIVEQIREPDPPHHVSYLIECAMVHAPSGAVLGTALGFASTRESKWGLISAQRKCPECQAPAIKVSKYEDGGFYCFDKLGGCGTKFDRADIRITKQPTGKVWREEMGEVANTVVKMAVKRAKVGAALTVTAASDAFDQDLEDLQDLAGEAGDDKKPDATPPSAGGKGPRPGAPTTKVDTGTRKRDAKAEKEAAATAKYGAETLAEAFAKADWHEFVVAGVEPEGRSWEQLAREHPETLRGLADGARKQKGDPTPDNRNGWSVRELRAIKALSQFNAEALKAPAPAAREPGDDTESVNYDPLGGAPKGGAT